MFGHIYKYRLRTLLRSRILIFWTLLYPIVLGTFFAIAFHNIGSDSPFTAFPIAVVDNAAWQNDTTFQSTLKGISADNPAADTKLFQLSVTDQQQADQNLKDGKIVGYLVLEGDHGSTIRVVVHSSGLAQSILRQFADSYLQNHSAYTAILTENPAAMESLSEVKGDYPIIDASPRNLAGNSTLPYFYSLIAMAALFGGFWGQREVSDSQADQSDLGQRLGVAPIHKLKAVVAGMCAAITIQFGCLMVLLAYVTLVLGIHFTAPLPLLLLACLLGSSMGVTFGAFLSSLPIRKEGIKISVLIATSMALSFLSGLMVSTIKYTVIHAAPIMAYINPANVLSDVFYALYAYTDYSRFFLNLGLLGAFSIVFSLVIYLFTRRQRYESL